MNLTEIVKSIEDTKAEMETLQEEYKLKRQGLEAYLKNMERLRKLALDNFDMAKVATAEKILRVTNWYKRNSNGGWYEFFKEGEAPEVLKDAVKQLIEDPSKFKTHYIATKDYDRWVGQYVGWCEHYMGPKHGSTTFTIAFKLRDKQPDLTQEEVEACVYYLEKQAFRVLGEDR